MYANLDNPLQAFLQEQGLPLITDAPRALFHHPLPDEAGHDFLVLNPRPDLTPENGPGLAPCPQRFTA
jgi:hypothetical protein